MELATYALTPEKSRGRLYADFTNVIRSPFQRDRDRLIHSSAFRRLDGKTVGHGGSITLKELGLLDRLQSHAVVRSHWLGDSFADAAAAPVYLTSVNALAETGELINIDRNGNTTAATIPSCLYDYEKELRKGDNLILSAFGGGYTWGAIYVKWAYDGSKACQVDPAEK